MKKILVMLVVLAMLSGCSLQTFEKVEDGNEVQAMATPSELKIRLPDSAAAPAMQGDSGELYFCGDYDLAVETLPSGNLSSTLAMLTGFEKENLALVQTVRSGVSCWEGAWSSAGEAGDQIGRVLILDDGVFHYCVTITAPAEVAGEYKEEWNSVLASVSLAEN